MATTVDEVNAAIDELNEQIPASVWQCPRVDSNPDDLAYTIETDLAIPADLFTYVNRATSVDDTDGAAIVAAAENLIDVLNDISGLYVDKADVLRQ